jgi:hypothetical protein
MLFPALGTVTAMWLLFTPLIGLETGFRATVAISFGLAALALAPLSVRFRSAGRGLALLGGLLAAINFIELGTGGMNGMNGMMANFASCAVALVIAGMAPMPVVVPAGELEGAAPVDHAIPAPLPADEEETAPIKAAA